MPAAPTRLDSGALNVPVRLLDGSGVVQVLVAANGDLTIGTATGKVGFYGVAPVALQTGVAVTAGGIHAALVALNLITA